MLRLMIIFGALLVCIGIVGAGVDDFGAITPYRFPKYFESDSKPMKSEIIGNPLYYAGERIGLDVYGVELPRAYENNYRFTARFPIIDYVSNSPLFMKQWAESTSAEISSQHRKLGIGAVSYVLRTLRGTGDYSRVEYDSSRVDVSEFDEILSKSNFTSRYRYNLVELYRGLLIAHKLVSLSRVNLIDSDREFFLDNPGYYLAPDGATMPSLTGNVDTHMTFIQRARRLKFEYVFKAAEIVSDAVNRYIAMTEGYDQLDYFINPDESTKLFSCWTRIGVVMIGGLSSDTLREDAVLTIDLGGNDVYLNNAGGCVSMTTKAAICIDHSGNDLYDAPDRKYVQGFGFMGTGCLVDLGGSDSYNAGHFSQGAGILGVGILWDRFGDDTFTGQTFCQGAGMFGLGMLLDDSGEDTYDCASLGQGAATTLGLGLISDLHGDDRYLLAVGEGKDALGRLPGYGQGGALSFRHLPWKRKLTPYGGVGMLVDNDGNDRYRSEGWCDQGGSYIMSLGVLYDAKGNDHYSAQTGQGSGIHITNAILVDRYGDDIYEGGFRCGGSGSDRSPGFLIDYNGDDIYRGRTSSYGTGCKPFSFSLLLDYRGSDRYISSEPKGKIEFNNWDSFGGVWPESEPHNWPYAICIDLGGNDAYDVRNRSNNSERPSFGHGIHLDTEWKGGDLIGHMDSPLEAYDEFELPPSVALSLYSPYFRDLQTDDTFLRFQSVGSLVNSNLEVVPLIVDALVLSDHRQFNRDLMQCIHHFLAYNLISERGGESLVRLLDAKDEEVRIIAADDFGSFRITEAGKALIDAAENDESAQVRRFAIKSLMAMKSRDGISTARYLASYDPSEHVRRQAVEYVSTVRNDVDPLPLLRRVLDTDLSSTVKVAAATGIGRLGDARGKKALKSAAKSQDIYVKRAAGKALAELGEVEGIGYLIESLSFPSIDAFYNYDYNIPNFISAYSGYDMPEPDRYDQEKWRSWFDVNKGAIDLGANIESFQAFEALNTEISDLEASEQFIRYEAFIEKHPSYPRSKQVYSKKLNQEAWQMVTAPKKSYNYNPATGLKYALRAVELNPVMDYYDTLAEAYLANGMIEDALRICQMMLAEHPGEKMFIDRIQRCETLLEGE